MKLNLRYCFFVLLFASLGAFSQVPTVQTFIFTGAVQTFTVPQCVSTITINTQGAQGSMNGFNEAAALGGLGGSATGVMTVTAGNVLYVYVGGTNGFNGGGAGGLSPCITAIGGKGGGASDVRLNVNALANRVIVGAGGGGAGGNRVSGCGRGTGGGGGGGYYGGGGGAGWGNATVPTGGTQIAGGAGGLSGTAAYNGLPGTLGIGGNGGIEISSAQAGPNSAGSGGAGGGLTGNNGVLSVNFCGQSGAGGSSYISTALTNSATATGVRAGNGIVTFSYTFSGAGVAGSASSNSICTGSSVTLTASNVLTYTWNPGGSNATSIVVSPTTTSTYTVQGTNSFNCISSVIFTITVDQALPSLTVVNTATSASGICPGNTVMITASGATTYSWVPFINNGVVFNPTIAATYVVTGANACGSSTAATSVSVHPIPPVTASISQPSICSANTVVTIGGGASTYTWSHGYLNGQPFFPPATTIYTVTGTSALNCTASAVVGVTVVNTPLLAPVATPTLICMGGSGTVAVSGASNYTWLPVPLTGFAGSNSGTIIITPTATATYTVVKANSNCYDTKTITVYVNALPSVFAIATPSIVCTGKTTTLSGGGANTYTWIPSSFNLVGTNVVVTPTANTIYTVTGSDGTCTATYNLLVPTLVTPTITAVATATSICAGGTVTLTASGAGTGGTYSWTPGGAGASIVVNPPSPISYVVEGTNTVNCSSQTSQVVIVFPNPVVNAVPNKTLVCVGGPSTITASGAHTYVWGHGPLTQTTLVNPIVTTVYTVTGTYTTTGCSGTKTVQVQAYTPVTAITGPSAVCIGSSITISSAPAISYTWSAGGIPFSYNAAVVVGPTVATTYSLGTTSMSSNVTCVGSNTVNIIVNPLPIVTASCTRTVICRNFESTTLNGGGAVSYNWLFLGAGSSVVVSPTAPQTTYTVEGTDANGCLNTATITIKTSACPGMGENTIVGEKRISVYPNPGHGEFNIKAEQAMELQLVNELGQVIRQISLNTSNNYQVTIKDVANGIYFVVGKNKETTVSQKVIVEK